MLDDMEFQMNRPGSFILRSGLYRTVVGFGVTKEWRAFTLKQALAMLDEMRRFPGWKIGYLSYEFGALRQGLKLRRKSERFLRFPKTPLLHFIVPLEIQVHDSDAFDLKRFLREDDFTAATPRQEMSYRRYASGIRTIHQALSRGETYELNFAHRFSGSFEGEPFEVFRRLQHANPSPHACYFNFEPVTVVSCSPERLVSGRLGEDGRLHCSTRPIKGTVPRGKTVKIDAALKAALLASKKDAAELNMIVDLARNDLGRVCDVGTVRVADHRVIESYSHVHHTMSTVEGVLCKGLDWVDVLRALFPGGSITGAPKVRTMELIDALESCPRGVYTGSAGWISPEGEFDFNILIRTVVFSKGRYSFHSGGAIVVDSKPREEYEETLHKAGALMEALMDRSR